METGLGANLIGPYMDTCTGCCKCPYRAATVWLVPGAMEKGERVSVFLRCFSFYPLDAFNVLPSSTPRPLSLLLLSSPLPCLCLPVYATDKEKQQKLLVNKESKEKRADMRDQQKQKVGHMTSHDLSPAPFY